MVIEKISLKVVRKPNRVESDNMSSEEDEFQKRGVALEEDGDDCDSGAGSDEFDLLELGETGEEFCQIGDQTCSVPFELYDLPGLEDVLSMDVWNDLLTDDERLNLTKYLPDMDQEHFMRTVKDLFTGSNFHFGVPMTKFYNMLKGGLCEPRVSIYRQGVGFIQKHRHYHVIRKHQNTMVNKLVQARDVWSKCRGYSIDEKIRVLHIMKSQKSLMNENTEELETDSSEESADGLWSNKTLKEYKPKGKQNLKGTQKVSGSKTFTTEERVNPFSSLEVKHGPSSSSSLLSRQMRDHEENAMYDVTVHGEHNLTIELGRSIKVISVKNFKKRLWCACAIEDRYACFWKK
ncbi:putative nuclear factor related to kappa-B-binding protein [Helianthus annuus]|nr:putative nuclear factor related to kappa-B-binding protein [Helianthus annuus]